MIQARMEQLGGKAKEAARFLMLASTEQKNQALQQMAGALAAETETILQANQIDMEQGKQKGLSSTLLDRLMLSRRRIEEMSEGLLAVAALPDPVGEVIEMYRRPNGLEVGRIRVPLGVIGIIYEARPNVTADAAGLCLKTGNAIILRGGSEAFNSNQAIARVLAQAAIAAGIHEGAIQLVDTTDREAANILMRMNRYVDVLIPRGGTGLIQTVVDNATVPVIKTGVGNCHTYVDEDADLDMALEIAINAKCQRPSVCNAMESLLVHEGIAGEFLPLLSRVMRERQVEIRGCERFQEIDPDTKAATVSDWETEFLDFVLAVKVVKDLDEAMEHINRYGTGHSEAIVTRSYERARRFLAGVDAAAVFVNASTRFTDGFQFGLGAEIGISTQKLHARGPMGLKELTSAKYIIYGNGQIRT